MTTKNAAIMLADRWPNSGLLQPRKTKISSTFDYNVLLKINILESLRPKKLADFPVR